MGLLDGKRVLITGVLTRDSLAYAVAELAQQEGAEIVLTGAGRGLSLTARTARRLAGDVDVLELDVTDDHHPEAVRAALAERWDRVDGALHAIAFAPETALGGQFLNTGWDDVAVALRISAYSLRALADTVTPLMTEGGSIVGLDFDGQVAWPGYDWMGVCKAALESVTRYLARDLGPKQIRVNAISAGPIRTMAAKGIPGFTLLADAWSKRAPLGWDVGDPTVVARVALWLFSDWSRGVCGELIHVDGGFHAMGTDLLSKEEQAKLAAEDG
ncbi:MAG TPA: enoyl-ACP reductase FabI [Actinomycetota bacterium]|nr:enoyl-ACP reductase FabI [Actinomycetota bacterium]